MSCTPNNAVSMCIYKHGVSHLGHHGQRATQASNASLPLIVTAVKDVAEVPEDNVVVSCRTDIGSGHSSM